jgi:quercetin 2,3-dioxygenase
VRLELPEGHIAAVVVLSGTLRVNDAQLARDAQVVLLERGGRELTLEAHGDAKVLLLAGEPLDEPIVGYGPFVMNERAEIDQAVRDFNEGRFAGAAAS